MKKYFLTFIFIFGFFVFGLSTNLVKAESNTIQYEITPIDPYNNKVLEINLSDYDQYVSKFIVTELRVCDDGEAGCETYAQAKNSVIDYSETPMKVVGDQLEIVIPETLEELNYTFNYTIQSENDGDIFILIRSYELNGAPIISLKGNLFLVYKLSTLNQRVVVNPDGLGVPTYSYNNIQYTPARNNRISIDLLESEYVEYTGVVYVCEYRLDANYKCLKYTVSDEPINYYIESYGDGEKVLNFYLAKRDQVITDNEFNNTNSTLISKKVILDTVGPKITIDGGQWVYLKSGQKYTEQNATCEDAVFPGDKCNVTNDLKVVRIDYTSDKYQLITYQASDRLGNISSIAVKVKVEIIVKDNSTLIAIVASGLVVLATVGILTVVVYKNHQKKKKLSYI